MKLNVTKVYLLLILNLNLATSIQNCVWDTGSCARYVQTLRDRRSHQMGDVVLKVGNESSISSLAVSSLDLHLAKWLALLNLKNVYFIPSVCRNIISVSCSDTDGFCL